VSAARAEARDATPRPETRRWKSGLRYGDRLERSESDHDRRRGALLTPAGIEQQCSRRSGRDREEAPAERKRARGENVGKSVGMRSRR
jgi:hypothetical protein